MSRGRAKTKAPKTPFSFRKHIVPPLAGVLVMVLVFGLLNAEYLLAQYRYYFSRPAVVALAPVAAPAAPVVPQPKPDPSKPAELTVPAIGVKAPIITDITDTVEWKIQLGLRQGTVHYGPTALPGQPGTVVIIGHSSGAPWAPGNYKWVFTLLDKLKPGDQIQISYQGLPYVYEVTGSTVVAPTDMSVLAQSADPTLELITCTPVGTSKNRLVVHAKQVSPKPVKPAAPTTNKKASQPKLPAKTTLPGGSDHSRSLWQVVKSWF